MSDEPMSTKNCRRKTRDKSTNSTTAQELNAVAVAAAVSRPSSLPDRRKTHKEYGRDYDAKDSSSSSGR
jgi:hypothetical protein